MEDWKYIFVFFRIVIWLEWLLLFFDELEEISFCFICIEINVIYCIVGFELI